MMEKEKFDLMLLDLVMPIMDGFGVLEHMKKANNQIPVIVSRNLSQEADLGRAKELGAKDYFIKSDTPINDVISHIKEILGQS